jgi:hypothetical protein
MFYGLVIFIQKATSGTLLIPRGCTSLTDSHASGVEGMLLVIWHVAQVYDSVGVVFAEVHDFDAVVFTQGYDCDGVVFAQVYDCDGVMFGEVHDFDAVVFTQVYDCDAVVFAQVYDCDAVVFAVGISGLQKIVAGSPTLGQREEFRRVNNLGSLDVLAGAQTGWNAVCGFRVVLCRL